MSAANFTSFSTGKNVVPSDATLLQFKNLYVGGTGNITYIDEAGTSVLITAIPVGTILPIRGTKVMATGTTATLIVAWN